MIIIFLNFIFCNHFKKNKPKICPHNSKEHNRNIIYPTGIYAMPKLWICVAFGKEQKSWTQFYFSTDLNCSQFMSGVKSKEAHFLLWNIFLNVANKIIQGTAELFLEEKLKHKTEIELYIKRGN